MARKSKRRRQQEEAEREELLAPDAFEAQGTTVTPWLERNFKFIAAALVLALGGVAVWELTRASGDSAASTHTRALIDATDAYAEAVGVQSVFSSTTAEARRSRIASARARLDEGELRTAPAGVGALAALYEADLARRQGDYDAALAGYDAYLAETEALEEDPLRYFALEGRGYALEGAGRLDEALEAFRRIEAMPSHADFGAFHVGRVLTRQGDTAGARAAFERVTGKVPTSPLAEEAERKLAALDAS